MKKSFITSNNRTLLNKAIITFLSIFFIFSFISCEDLLKQFLGDETETESFTIEKSGLSQDKYLAGTIDGTSCDIVLFAKTADFSATKVSSVNSSNMARDANKSDSYEGKFVYNYQTKTLYL